MSVLGEPREAKVGRPRKMIAQMRGSRKMIAKMRGSRKMIAKMRGSRKVMTHGLISLGTSGLLCLDDFLEVPREGHRVSHFDQHSPACWAVLVMVVRWDE